MLSISEDGTTATIDGQPASGSFVLEDGKTVVCENGAVKSISEAQAAQPAAPVAPNTNPVTPAPAPAHAPAPQTAEQRIAAMQEEITLGPSEICNPSRFMIHNPRTVIEGVMTANDMIQGANELIKIENEMAQGYADYTGLPIDTVKQMMAKETVLTAQEAVKLGFVKGMIESTHLTAVALGKSETKTIEDKLLEEIKGLLQEA